MQEVLQVAGGLPNQAAVDELNYTAPDTGPGMAAQLPAIPPPPQTA